MSWKHRLEAAAREVRQAPNTAVLERTERLLEDLIAAVRAGERVGSVRDQVLALRAELDRAETVARRMAAAEAGWARAVWAALDCEPGLEYGVGGGGMAAPRPRRLTWEG